MSYLPFSTNPMWWAQLNLQGGWQRQLATAAIYFVLVAAGLVVTMRVEAGITVAQVARGWLLVVTLIQVGLLFVLGSGSIRKAVQRDFTTGMIESHRLTPMSSLTMAIGYLIGPCFQTLVVYACGVVTGSILCWLAGADVGYWWITMGLLLVLALMVWSIFVVLSLSVREYAGVLTVAILVLLSSWQFIVQTLPGSGLLVGLTYWDIPGLYLHAQLGTLTAGALLLQIGVIALCLAGAARTYRREDLRAFSPGLGLALLFWVAVICGYGLLYQDSWRFAPVRNVLSNRDLSSLTQLFSAFLAGVVFALLPVSAAAQEAADPYLRRSLLARAGRLLLVILAATVVPFGVYVYVVGSWERLPRWFDHTMWLQTAACMGLGLLSIGPYMWLWYRFRSRVFWPVVGYLFLVWLVPPVVDAIQSQYSANPEDALQTWLAGVSPAGSTLLLWEQDFDTRVPGLVVQGVLLLGLWSTVAYMAWRSSRIRPSHDPNLATKEVV